MWETIGHPSVSVQQIVCLEMTSRSHWNGCRVKVRMLLSFTWPDLGKAAFAKLSLSFLFHLLVSQILHVFSVVILN